MDHPSLDLNLFREKTPKSLSDSVSTPTPLSSSPSLHLDLFRAASYIPKEIHPFDPKSDFETVKRLRDEGKTFKEIEKLTHIPRSTANDLVQKPSLRHGSVGRTPYLSDLNLQKQFYDKVVEKTLDHKPPTAVEAAELAGQVISSPGHSVHPSPSWARKFAANHPEEYNFTVPKSLEKERVLVDDPDILVSWHDDMETALHPNEVPACLTFNMDEFKLEVSQSGKSRVLIPKNIHKPSKIKDPQSTPEHITIALLSSPEPEVNRSLRHLVILPLVNIPSDLMQLNDIFDFSGNPGTGWTNQAIFNAQCQSIAAQIAKIREKYGFPPNTKAILWLDADTSRRCPEALEHLEKNNISGAGLLAHSTTVDQPLDGGIIGSVKQKASSRLRSIQEDAFPNRSIAELSMSEKRLLYLKSIRDGIRETYSVDDRIKKAWAQSSLFPFNREVLFKTAEQKEKPLDRSKLEKMMAAVPGKRIPIHGRVLTDQKTYFPLWDEKRRQKPTAAPKTFSGKKVATKVRPKRREPLPSSSPDQSDESSSEESCSIKISKKNKEKSNKEPTNLKRPRSASGGEVLLIENDVPQLHVDRLPERETQLPTSSLQLKDIRHAEDELLYFVNEDGKRNRRFDAWTKEQKNLKKPKK